VDWQQSASVEHQSRWPSQLRTISAQYHYPTTNKHGTTSLSAGTGGRCCICTHQMAALFCVKWRHGRHLDIMASYPKPDSINPCIFAWRTILSNFIQIQFETTWP